MAEIPVLLPKWGASMEDATVVEWLRQPGERVEVDESICVIETDKVDAEVPAPAAGVLGAALAEPGSVVAVGTRIATIVTDA